MPTAPLLSAEFASRVQFGWTISVHILFASLSIGLAPFIVYFTWKDVKTGDPQYARLREFWVKLFGIGFVMGTVTGIPMSFQFGTNFPVFAEAAGEMIGGPLAFEAKMAFFLEAVFLGVLLFGRERVSDRTFVLSSVLTGVGAWLSGFWILVVNAWMQTPQGFELVERNGMQIAQLTDPVAAFFTPRMPWMYVHMINASVISVTLLVAGVSAYFVWRKRNSEAWNTALRAAVVLLLLTAPLQAVSGGDFSEEVVGLHEYDDNPPVALVFWSFRFMVGLGFLFIGLALWGGNLLRKGRLSESDRYLRAMILATPLGFAALLTGWYVTEIGRQPWVIQGVLKTQDAVSTTLTGAEATTTLVAFVALYIVLLAAFGFAFKWLIEGELVRMGVREESDTDRPRLPLVSSDD